MVGKNSQTRHNISRCFWLTIVSGFGLTLIVCFLFFLHCWAGWLHKVFETHVFPFVFLRIIFFWWAVLKGGGWPLNPPPLDPPLLKAPILYLKLLTDKYW